MPCKSQLFAKPHASKFHVPVLPGGELGSKRRKPSPLAEYNNICRAKKLSNRALGSARVSALQELQQVASLQPTSVSLDDRMRNKKARVSS